MAGTATETVADPDAITEAGLDAQVAPLGKPAQVMLTKLLKPLDEAIFTG